MKKVSQTNCRKASSTGVFRVGNVLVPHSRNGINVSAAARSDFHSHGLQPAAGQSGSAGPEVLEELSAALGQVTSDNHPRTFKLLQSSRRKLARKVIEEACELTVEAVKRDAEGVVRESADLLYQLVSLWFHIGVEPVEVWREMRTRADTLGIAEKLPKPSHPKAGATKSNC